MLLYTHAILKHPRQSPRRTPARCPARPGWGPWASASPRASALPLRGHLPAGPNSGRAGAHLQNISLSAGGKREDAAGGAPGCPGRFLGRRRGAEPPRPGRDPPFPAPQRGEHTALLMRTALLSQHPKTPAISCALLPTFQAEPFKHKHAECRSHPLRGSPGLSFLCHNGLWMRYRTMSRGRCGGARSSG